MKLTIWKFELRIADEQKILMPIGAEILSVGCQQVDGHGTERPMIWAKIDPDAPKKNREVQIRGTGHLLRGDEGEFIGTGIMMNGALVWHIFISPEE